MTNPTPIYYTERTNELGDVLCLVDAYSDFGERGWMVCEEMRVAPYTGRRTPLVWFPRTQRNEALEAVDNWPFSGYPKVPEKTEPTLDLTSVMIP